jgi:hypothetical protein
MMEGEHEVVEHFIVFFATNRMDSLVTTHLNSVYSFLRSGVFTAMKGHIVGLNYDAQVSLVCTKLSLNM